MKLVLFLLIFLLFSWVNAQPSLKFTYHSSDKLPFRTIQSQFSDSITLKNYLNSLRYKAIEKGYLLFSVDSLHISEKEARCYLFVGPKFKNAFLSIEKEYQKLIKYESVISEKLVSKIAFTPKNVVDILQKIEKSLLNQGYPFAIVKLDSIRFHDTDLFAQIQIQKNRKVTWGEIILKGSSVISSSLLQAYIHVQSGETYQEEQVKNISNQLKQIPFLEETKPFELLFHEDKVDLYLYLNAKPVSLVTGVLGLQPNTKNNTTSYALTGDIRMKLVNLLKKAENIDLQWKNLQANTQNLKSSASFPTLFKTAFGVDGQFQLYKKDSTFLELKSSLGIQYILKNGNTLKLFYRNFQSSILSGGQSKPTLLQLANVHTNFYGISLFKQTIDYLPCPTKGFSIQLEGALGMRNRQDSSLHTSISSTAKFDYTFNTYYTFLKRNVIRFSNAVDISIAPSFVSNELIRFGGMATQRGFKEDELRATSRVFASLEYRFLLDQNSYLFLFFDQSWYENKLASTRRDSPYGFGGGLTFGTQLGMFSISYGLGKQLNNPILLSNGNIHFGYVSYF